MELNLGITLASQYNDDESLLRSVRLHGNTGCTPAQVKFGLLNTCIKLSSSWFISLASVLHSHQMNEGSDFKSKQKWQRCFNCSTYEEQQHWDTWRFLFVSHHDSLHERYLFVTLSEQLPSLAIKYYLQEIAGASRNIIWISIMNEVFFVLTFFFLWLTEAIDCTHVPITSAWGQLRE